MIQIRNDCLERVFQQYSHVVLFGAGAVTSSMFAAYKELGFEEKVDYIIDNDKNKDGKSLSINEKEIKLVSVETFARLHYQDYALLIMPVFFLDIIKQIDRNEFFNGVPAYVYAFVMNIARKKDFSLRTAKQMKIPKIIHYCWFGGKELPDSYKKNIGSWREHCPNYEIIEWNESNYDFSKNQFLNQAYMKKCWAYVSDYVRKDVVYCYGGVYMDVDVELKKPLDDLLYNDFFMCRDDIANIATGCGFGAEKGNEIIKALRDDYDKRRFVDDNGNIVGKACGNYETPVMIDYGYKPDNECQTIAGGKIFPREVLCPISWMGLPDIYSDKTVTVHKYDDFLVDKEGVENALRLRREIEVLLERAEQEAQEPSHRALTRNYGYAVAY
ncbi:MAG: hypothetical protein NC400_12190 [Clostridium sp.]|nr:hypothetical protein [Clostridium sp.]